MDLRETIYTIVDSDVTARRNPVVRYRKGEITTVSRTLYYRANVRDRDFTLDEIRSIAERFNVHPRWFTNALWESSRFAPREDYDLLVHPLRGAETVFIIEQLRRDAQARREREMLFNPVATPAEDEDCAVCLERCSEHPEKEWVTREGCDRHCFHKECIRKWGPLTCPVCRAPLSNKRQKV
jgi:hypothetical protein